MWSLRCHPIPPRTPFLLSDYGALVILAREQGTRFTIAQHFVQHSRIIARDTHFATLRRKNNSREKYDCAELWWNGIRRGEDAITRRRPTRATFLERTRRINGDGNSNIARPTLRASHLSSLFLHFLTLSLLDYFSKWFVISRGG